MNKKLDERIYYEVDSQSSNELNRLPQRKVLHSRILKLSGQNQYKVMGIALFESGQVQASLIPLKRATVIRPQDVEAQIHLAQAFIKLEKENEAFLCLQKALCSSPNNFQLHAAVIRTLYGQGKLEKLGGFYEETAKMLIDKRFLPGLYYTCRNFSFFSPFPMAKS